LSSSKNLGSERRKSQTGSTLICTIHSKASQLQDPANLGRFEFMRLVTDTPLEGFYPAAGNPLPILFLKMFFATEARAELERSYGGALPGARTSGPHPFVNKAAGGPCCLHSQPPTSCHWPERASRNRSLFQASISAF